ncbi:MAG: hypothetical protein ACYDDA_10150 [Acidiferrobacteraceae bacterium]
MRKSRWIALVFASVIHGFPRPAFALDYFELETYPYYTAARGETEVEGTGLYTLSGAAAPGSPAGTERSAFEVTRGLTSKTEVAGYLDMYRLPGGGWQQAATAIHVRTRFFQKNELPVDLGLYMELEMPRDQPDHLEGEVRGIVEKDFGRWTVDVNPILHHVLSGPDTAAGWKFQYATSLIYRKSERWQPRLDLFGDLGYLSGPGAWTGQQDLLSPAVDVWLERNVRLTAGVGFGLTHATEHRLLLTRLEWEFY